MNFMKIDKLKKIKLFYEMLRIRKIESKISEVYSEQQIRCPVHLSLGQEAVAVGICQNLENEEKIVTAHRSHAHYLAKGGSLKKFIAELYGKETGCAKGVGGSMHLMDIKSGIMAAVPIVGSTIPIGTGIAWFNKLKRINNVVVIFFGDGATEEGVFFESLDFASLHNLPIIFVCENNEYSVYSHISKRQYNKRKITQIAKSIGINSKKIYGNDIENIFLTTNKIKKIIKKKSRPFLLELETFRTHEHCGPNYDDHLNYRDKRYLKKWKKKCPIQNYKNYLFKNKYLNEKKLLSIEKKLDQEIINAFNFAKKSNFPKKRILKNLLYA